MEGIGKSLKRALKTIRGRMEHARVMEGLAAGTVETFHNGCAKDLPALPGEVLPGGEFCEETSKAPGTWGAAGSAEAEAEWGDGARSSCGNRRAPSRQGEGRPPAADVMKDGSRALTGGKCEPPQPSAEALPTGAVW